MANVVPVTFTVSFSVLTANGDSAHGLTSKYALPWSSDIRLSFFRDAFHVSPAPGCSNTEELSGSTICRQDVPVLVYSISSLSSVSSVIVNMEAMTAATAAAEEIARRNTFFP